MEFKRLNSKEYYCVVCDNWADYELSNNGHPVRMMERLLCVNIASKKF